MLIDKLSDAFESGYRSDTQTIYENGEMTNQYHGVRDLDLAIELAKSLGIDTESLGLEFKGKCSAVQVIKEAVMDQ